MCTFRKELCLVAISVHQETVSTPVKKLVLSLVSAYLLGKLAVNGMAQEMKLCRRPT